MYVATMYKSSAAHSVRTFVVTADRPNGIGGGGFPSAGSRVVAWVVVSFRFLCTFSGWFGGALFLACLGWGERGCHSRWPGCPSGWLAHCLSIPLALVVGVGSLCSFQPVFMLSYSHLSLSKIIVNWHSVLCFSFARSIRPDCVVAHDRLEKHARVKVFTYLDSGDIFLSKRGIRERAFVSTRLRQSSGGPLVHTLVISF